MRNQWLFFFLERRVINLRLWIYHHHHHIIPHGQKKKEGSFPPIVVCNMPDRKQSTGVLKQNSFAWAIKGPPIFVPSKKGAAGQEYSRRMLFLKSIIFNPLVQENSKINSTNFVFSQERCNFTSKDLQRNGLFGRQVMHRPAILP